MLAGMRLHLGRRSLLFGVPASRVVLSGAALSPGVMVVGGAGAFGRASVQRLVEHAVVSKDEARSPAALVVSSDSSFGEAVFAAAELYSSGSAYLLALGPGGCSWNPLEAPWLGSVDLAARLLDAEEIAAGQRFPARERLAALHLLRWCVELLRRSPEGAGALTFERLHALVADIDAVPSLLKDFTARVFARYRYEVHVLATDYRRVAGRLERVVVSAADVAASLDLEPPGLLQWSMLGPGRTPREYSFSWSPVGDRYVADVDRVHYAALRWVLDGHGCERPSHVTSHHAWCIPFGACFVEQPSPDELALSFQSFRWYNDHWWLQPRRVRHFVVARLVAFLGLFAVPPYRAQLSVRSPDRLVALPPVPDLLRRGAVLVCAFPDPSACVQSRVLNYLLKRAWLDAVRMERSREESRAVLLACSAYEDLVAGPADAAADAAAISAAEDPDFTAVVHVGSFARLRAVAGRAGVRALRDALRSVVVLAPGAASAPVLARLLLPASPPQVVAAWADRLASLPSWRGVARVAPGCGPSRPLRVAFSLDSFDPSPCPGGAVSRSPGAG